MGGRAWNAARAITFKVYNDDETAVSWNIDKGIFMDWEEGLED